MKKINELMKKVLTREVILYVVFGVLTTLVNIATSSVLNKIFQIEGNLSSTIGIIVCILFAYFTNRKLVFNSKAETIKEKILEFVKFIFGRAFTMVVEMIGFFLLYTVCIIPFLTSKIIISVIVIILNFFISKFFAFKK
ncbi:MAG: GtrA family protein [Clostridiaceae bacterium]|nr:GtrA family protein [Clostridiaceae bacterium]